MAKNVIVMALLAAVNRGFLKNRMSSIGVGVCSSHVMNDAERDDADGKGADDERVAPALRRALDDAEQQRSEADDRQRRTERIEPALVRVTRRGDEEVAGDERQRAERQVDPEHRAPLEVAQEEAARHRAERHGETGEAGPHGDRSAPLTRVAEDVGQDRQRGRHDQRPADAHERPAGHQLQGARRQRGRRRADGEQDDADLQGALAAEPVAEAARRQQQSGEHERVGIDDPLDLAVRGVEIADQRRDRHVEDRVVHDDDQQGEAQHAERPPPPRVDALVERHLPVVHCCRHHVAPSVRILFRY